MKLAEARLHKKSRSVMLVGFGQLSADEKEAHTHEWSLRRWSWRAWKTFKTPLSSADGQMLEWLASRTADTPYAAEALRAQTMLVRLLLSRQAVDEAWATLLKANPEALAVMATDHGYYEYGRLQRPLRWTDDLHAPTPPTHSLARGRATRRITGGSKWLQEKQDEAEAKYQQYYQERDIEFVRPDLYQDLEPFVTTLMARGREVIQGLATVRKTGKELLYQAKQWKKTEHARAVVPAVSTASAALRQLEARFVAPGEDELADLTAAVAQERQVQAEVAEVLDRKS